MKKTLIPIALVFALIAVAPAAFAATAGSTLTVQASVTANCTIANATLNFGAYDPVVANATALLPKDGSTTMTVACTKGFIPTIGIPPAGRSMAGGGDTLNYELYKDAARTTLWGDAGAALFTPPSGPGKGGTAYTIYGRIAGGQDVGVAAYSGTIQVTVNF
jgi:spore coat protein U-like protein